jgi:two-component system, OmpR family, phosphate regulon sensor histidine kinase PhoR
MALFRKNLHPRLIALLAGLLTAVLSFLLVWGLFNQPLKALLVAAVLFLMVYLLTHYLVREYVYKKIRLLYKFISQTKASKREEFYMENLLPRQTLDDVREDVENWAAENTAAFNLLERNEQYRKEFLQNLSHELKTPIFSMQGYVESLLDGGMNDPQISMRFLQNTHRNIDRLRNLVEDLDEITKLESGQQTMNQSVFVMQELIKEVTESLQLNAEQKKIRFEFKRGSEALLKVVADKEKIRQVLTNLIDNALKYGKTNGKVVATVEKTDEELALIEITDDGAGIAKEHLPRIFERFYRTDMARSRKIGGSGLGLAICKHIIEAHGQAIHVRSQEDVGTTFGFTLKRG